MKEQLERDPTPEELLEWLYGLKRLDRQCFRTVVESEEPLTIDEIAERVDRERSTAYRAVQRLLECGFLRKEQINYDHGGYYHVYSLADPAEAARAMQRLLNDWYATVGQLIYEFEETYERPPGQAPPTKE